MMTELDLTLESKASGSEKKESRDRLKQWDLEHTSQIEQMVKPSQRCQTSRWEVRRADHNPLLNQVMLM